MKREATTKKTGPAIFRLLPEDHFFQIIEDVHRLVARRAYELFRDSGFIHGHDLDDWLKAESEILEAFPLEISETPEALIVKGQFPGFRGKDLEIHVEARRLFVSGQREEKRDKGKGIRSHAKPCANWLLCTADLPSAINPEKATATFIHGQLQVELAKCKTEKKTALAAKATA